MNRAIVRPLSPREIALLNEAEETIAAGLTTFIDVGSALLTINEGKLYRREFATFDEYCTAKWQIGRAYAYRLMEAVRTLLTLGDTAAPLPTNEAQARALAGVPEELRTEVWEKAHERTGGQPTAAAVRKAAQETAGVAAPAPDVEQAQTPSGTAPEDGPTQPSSGAPTDHLVAVAVAGPGEPVGDVQPSPASPLASSGFSGEENAGRGAATPLPAPSGEPATSPAGSPCEKCGIDVGAGPAADGFMRCSHCDPDGEHVVNTDGECGLCAAVAAVDDAYLPLVVAEGPRGLHLACATCRQLVAHLAVGAPLPLLLVEAHRHDCVPA